MKASKLAELRIDPALKQRPRGTVFFIFLVVALVLGVAVAVVWERRGGERRVKGEPIASTQAGEQPKGSSVPEQREGARQASELQGKTQAESSAMAPREGVGSSLILTVSGYIINRERIELSPRMQGVVAWIGVRKGDSVTKGELVVRLEDAEQQAGLASAKAGLQGAKVALERAELAFKRVDALKKQAAISEDQWDESRLSVAAAKAQVAQLEGQVALSMTYLDWTLIKSPIDGVVLEKLVEPGELVVPMSFGGPRGPSTALLAVADPKDLQVEIDINEADLAKIRNGGACVVTPEAYPSKHYKGSVVEIAPEANRQKGTLQVKVQILGPDEFLTPELSARVEFVKE